jgi:RecB family exonuclease
VPITLITGPANSGKARAILDAVARAVARGERPLLVLPTGADADRYRRELAQEGPVVGVEVCLFGDLLERVAQRAAAKEPALGRAPLSAGAREQMLATLARELPGAPAGGARALARALGGAIAELQGAGVTPAALRKASEASPAAGEVCTSLLVQLHERYDRALARRRVLDAELRARRALDVLGRCPALWSVGGRPAPVLLYGFDDLTGLQIDAVRTLGCVVEAAVTVALSYEPGRVAFAERAWAFEELAPHAAQRLTLPARSDYYAARSRPALHRIERRLFEPPDDDVPRSAEGVHLLAGDSQRGELELVAAQARALLDEGLAPEEIAIVHRTPASVAEELADALDAVGVPHAIARCGRFADTALGRALLGLLRCGCEGVEGVGAASLADLLAWLRAPGLLERVELADRLEQLALAAGVRDAASARRLWEREHWPLEAIDRVSAAARRGVGSLLERAQRELLRLFCAPRAHRAAVLDPAHDEAALALRAGVGVICELQELAGVGAELVGGAAGVLEALHEAGLRGGRAAHRASVAVLDPLSLRARRVRAMFLCGLQEGVFPSSSRSESAISDELAGLIASVCGSRRLRRAEALAAERYLLYASVSRPEERLFLSWHDETDDGQASAPSPFLEDVCGLFGGDLRTVGGGETAHSGGAPLRGAHPGGAVDSILDEHLLGELSARRLWSASSLERWAACPVSWFVERVLGAEGIGPEPEPRARGTLAHAVLGEALEALRSETGSAKITAASLPRVRALVSEALSRRRERQPISVAAERMPLADRRLEADLGRYLEHEAQQEGPLEPAHLELSFGFEQDGDGLPALELAAGVSLCGRMDRVDVTPDGQAVVYDYKSGRTGPDHSGAKWAQAGRFQMPLYMRAVGELMGLQAVGGLYQPLAGPDLRPRGALSREVDLKLRCVRTDACDGDRLAELVGAASETAVKAAREAQAGALEPRPQTCGHRGGCMYPTICRASICRGVR